ETAAKHGEDQVKIWRRSYDIPPPPLASPLDPYPGNDRRYADLKPGELPRTCGRCADRSAGELPRTESLKDTVARFLPYWHETIAPAITSGQRVLIAAHGNSLRALVKYLDNVSDQAIVELNTPPAFPLVYDPDERLKPSRHYYLGDEKAAAEAAARGAHPHQRGFHLKAK